MLKIISIALSTILKLLDHMIHEDEFDGRHDDKTKSLPTFFILIRHNQADYHIYSA